MKNRVFPQPMLLLGTVLGLSAALVFTIERGEANVVPDTSCSNPVACFGRLNNYSGGAIRGEADSSIGVEGVTKNPSASDGFGAAAVNGLDLTNNSSVTSNIGVFGSSLNGDGVVGTSTNGTGILVNAGLPSGPASYGANVGGLIDGTDYGTALFAIGHSSITHGPADGTQFFQAFGDSGGFMSVDDQGNIHINGILTTAGKCSIGCMRSKSVDGRDVTTYTERSGSPQIEDFGRAELIRGISDVRFDLQFAGVMDSRSEYEVYLTPEGDSHGLYIASKSPAGFEVRENDGGVSSLTFEYRIVAKPIDTAASHFPAWTSVRLPGR